MHKSGLGNARNGALVKSIFCGRGADPRKEGRQPRTVVIIHQMSPVSPPR